MLSQQKWQDKCAVFAAFNDPEASWMTYLGLYAQQHRGQEGAGIVSLQGGRHLIHRGRGLVGEVFTPRILKNLQGFSAIGHTRYGTTRGGGDPRRNVQPLTATLSTGPLALAHNGNIVNFPLLKEELMRQGSLFYGTSDTECLIHLLAREKQDFLPLALKECLPRLQGAYSLVLLTDRFLVAARDPMGFRPLVLGRRPWGNKTKADKTKGLNPLPVGQGSSPPSSEKEGKGRGLKPGFSYVLASETCAFDLIGAEYVREIAPGEIWTVDLKTHESRSWFLPSAPLHRCVFEYVYFSRPDSLVFGKSVYESRKQMGRFLAEEAPATADVVLPVPDSGVPGALGYSEKSSIPFEMGIVRNHYIGRTFIHPSESLRDFRVRIKLSPQKHLVKGKRVVVVDDSLVRGTTSRAVVALLKSAGAKEIHFRLTSPLMTDPCFYGVDTPLKGELIASQKTVSQLQSYLGVQSLAFLSHKALMQSAGGKGFCSACFTGRYPTPV